jgi:hypothetical protein
MFDGRPLIFGLTILLFTGCASAAPAGEPNAPTTAAPAPQATSELDSILSRLNQNLAKLESCRLELSWTFTQPLLETSTIRKGMLLYKMGKDRSRLRINFTSFQQDKEPAQPLREEIIFDGIWLTRIDYQLQEIKRDQVARDDKPLHAFQLLSGRIPLLGFGSVDDLKKQFEISLVKDPNSTDGLIHLTLRPRPDSDYKGDYKTIDIFTRPSAALPERIGAVTADDDISLVTLAPAGPQEVADSVFAFEQPGGFAIISKPLKNDDK